MFESMMFYTVCDPTMRKNFWAGRHKCPHCNRISDFSLQNTKKTFFGFFIIPFLTIIDDRYIVCENCNYKKKLKIRTYSEIASQEKKLFEEGKYPQERIEIDFDPSQFPIGLKIYKLVLSTIWLLLWLVLTILDFRDSKSLEFFLFPLLNSIPFVISLNSLLTSIRKRSMHKHKSNYPHITEALISEASSGVYEKVGFHIDNERPEVAFEKAVSEFSDFTDNQITSQNTENTYNSSKNGFGWVLAGVIFMVLPLGFLRKKVLHSLWNLLMNGSYRSLLVIHSILKSLAFVIILYSIIKYACRGDNAFSYILIAVFALIISIPFSLINLINAGRVRKSLEMLYETDNLKYVNEVIPYIGKTNRNYILTEHLLYNEKSRCIFAYSNILWAYTVTDENNNTSTVLYMADGKRYSVAIGNLVFNELIKRHPHILSGNSKENSLLYKEKISK